jgi:hypothetical protein
MTVIEHRWSIFPAGAWPANLRNALGLIWQRQLPSQDSPPPRPPMRFVPQPLVTTCHVPLRNPCAPRCQGEPMQIEPSQRGRDDNDGNDGHGGDDGGDDGDDGDDGDQNIHGNRANS